MIELPRFVPARQDGLIPQPVTPNFYPGLPYYLRKYVLKKVLFEEGSVPESLWNKRGDYIENRVQDLITALPGVEIVTRHDHGSKDDIAGRDLTVQFEDESTVFIQVKSSRFGTVKFKQAIRDKYFPHSEDSVNLVNAWMTKERVILLNGSETRSDQEILASFYSQLSLIKTAESTQLFL